MMNTRELNTNTQLFHLGVTSYAGYRVFGSVIDDVTRTVRLRMMGNDGRPYYATLTEDQFKLGMGLVFSGPRFPVNPPKKVFPLRVPPAAKHDVPAEALAEEDDFVPLTTLERGMWWAARKLIEFGSASGDTETE
jgi:hypothetical protein